MTRARLRVALVLLFFLAARSAWAQASAVVERQAHIGGYGGVPVPVTGAAAAEEATALFLNPAGIGFVSDPQAAWFHESEVTPGSRGDALFLADRLGPLGLGFGFESIRPGQGDGSRWRRSTFGLTLGDGRAYSLGLSWDWFGSPNLAIDRAKSWNVGATIRPYRFLSFSAAADGRDERVGALRVPVAYDFGLGIRLLDDSLTLTGDLLGDDLQRDSFRLTHSALGASVLLPYGLALSLAVEFPVRSDPSVYPRTVGTVSVGWNTSHLGIWAGALPGTNGYDFGLRASVERYRGFSPRETPTLDVTKELAAPSGLLALLDLGEHDPWGELLEKLALAGEDRAVGGLVLRMGPLDIGSGKAEELRTAIAALNAKKPVLAWIDGADTRSYWVATAASAIAVEPGAALFVNGLGTSRIFLKDTLAKIGVAVDVVKVGAYKSAPEPLVRNDSSPESLDVTNALLDESFGQFVNDVAVARRMSPDRVRALVDQGLFTGDQAKEAGLVDAVLWRDEVGSWASTRTGVPTTSDRYGAGTFKKAEHWGRPPVIAIVRVEGTIAEGESRTVFGVDAIAGAETIARQIREAAADRDVRAIVLRIDSPGGDGGAGDVIWREVTRANSTKPVIVSMGDLAASAGYLIAVGADTIVAEPSTLTGSIGVFALKPDLSGLLAKLSIHRESFLRGENSDLLSLAKPWTSAERAAVQHSVDAFYASFVAKVAEGRKLSTHEVLSLAGGHVWSGRAALERRLIDRLGSLEDAIAIAKERAHLGRDVLVRRGDTEGGALAGSLLAVARTVSGAASPAERALWTLASLAPEARALVVLAQLGPLIALPVDWVIPGTDR